MKFITVNDPEIGFENNHYITTRGKLPDYKKRGQCSYWRSIEREKVRKIWEQKRANVRKSYINNDQIEQENDAAQLMINEYYDQYYTCNCDSIKENNVFCYCYDCEDDYDDFCYNCEGRLHKLEQGIEEPTVIKENMNVKMPWGSVNVQAEYIVPQIPQNTLKKFEQKKKEHEKNVKRQEWYEQNAFEIHTIIDLILSNNKNKRKIGHEKMKILTNNSEELNKFFQYYINHESNFW
jgi:hypothetical protein